MIKSLIGITALAGLLVSQSALNIRLNRLAPAWAEESPGQAEPPANRKKLDPALFKVLSFGQLPSAVDWLWLTCLVDPAVTPVAPGNHPLIYYNFELITRLDDAFFSAYIAGADLLAVIRRDAPGAVELLKRAEQFRKNELPAYPREFRERFWSTSFSVPLLLAYTYLFEMNDLPSAAQAFREASTVPGAPAYLGTLVQRFEKPNGIYEVGLRLLEFMARTAPDAKSRSELTRKRESLRLSLWLLDVNQDFSDYLGRRKKPASEPEWHAFRALRKLAAEDPNGGRLFLNNNGRIDSTTPRESVLGLASH